MHEATPEQIADLEAVLGSPASEQHLAALALANRVAMSDYPDHVAFALLAAQTVNLSVEPAPESAPEPAPVPEPAPAPEPTPEVPVEPTPEVAFEPEPAEPDDLDTL